MWRLNSLNTLQDLFLQRIISISHFRTMRNNLNIQVTILWKLNRLIRISIIYCKTMQNMQRKSRRNQFSNNLLKRAKHTWHIRLLILEVIPQFKSRVHIKTQLIFDTCLQTPWKKRWLCTTILTFTSRWICLAKTTVKWSFKGRMSFIDFTKTLFSIPRGERWW